MTKFLFRSFCPICLNGDIITWTHTNCGGNRYIDENLYLTCEKCNSRTYILDSTFSCPNHEGSKKTDLMSLIQMISLLDDSVIDFSTRKKMIKLLTDLLWK